MWTALALAVVAHVWLLNPDVSRADNAARSTAFERGLRSALAPAC